MSKNWRKTGRSANTPLEHIILTSPADFLPPALHALYPLSQRNVKHPEPPLTARERFEDKTLHTMNAMWNCVPKGNRGFQPARACLRR